MRVNKLLILFIIMCFAGCKTSQIYEVPKLKIKEIQIKKALALLEKEEYQYGSLQKQVAIIRIESIDDRIELRLGMLSKKNMKFYLKDVKDELVGFFYYNKITVVVFGEQKSIFFKKTNKKKDMPFLKPEPKLEVKAGEIPPPPVIYEPFVWIYNYDKGVLKMVTMGRFSLLSEL